MSASSSDMGSNGASGGQQSNKTARAAAAVGDAAHAAADKISGAAESLASGVTAAQQRGNAVIKEAGDTVRARVESASAMVTGQSDRIFEGMRTYTKQNPMLALGLAAGAGILLSRLFIRR